MRYRISLLLLLVAMAGCSTSRMPVDESLNEFLAVEGRDGWKIKERVTFGAFTADRIERSWTKGRSLDVRPIELDRRRQSYSFTLTESGRNVFDVSCIVGLARGAVATKIVDVEFRNSSRVDCTIAPENGARGAWALFLEENGERPLKGALEARGVVFDIDGTNRLRKSLPVDFTTGYHIRRAGRDVAAVEVINSGGIWLDARLDVDQRQVVAATAGALLLLEDLHGSIENV